MNYRPEIDSLRAIAVNHKAFTLIELLVVVAIIGILAAVGVVAYNGYTNAAKVSAVKAQHGQVVKFISNEMMKCTLGEKLTLNNDNTDLCPMMNVANQSAYNTHQFALKFLNHFGNWLRWKNVYDNSVFTDSCSSPAKKGQLCFASGKGSIIIRTQTKDGSGNILESKIPVE